MPNWRLVPPTGGRSEAHTRAIEYIGLAAKIYERLKDEGLSDSERLEMKNDFDCLSEEARFLCRDLKPKSSSPPAATID